MFKQFRRALAAIIIFSFSFNTPALGDSWIPRGFDPTDPGNSITYKTSDTPSDRVWNSSLIAANSLNGISTPSFICNSYSDKECNLNPNTRVFAILPLCDNSIRVACINNLTLGGQNLTRLSKSSIDFPEDVNRNLPAGSTPSLWKNPVDNKLFLAKVVSYAWPFSNTPQFSVYVDVWEVIETECKSCERYKPIQYSSTSVSTGNILAAQSAFCVWVDTGVCYKSSTLSQDKSIGISIKSPKDWFGWVFSRTENAIYSYQDQTNSNPIHTFTANPISVPVLGVSYSNSSEIPAEIVEAVGKINPGYFLNLGVPEIRGIVTYNDFGKKVIGFMGEKPDTTDYLDTVWRFTTLSNTQNSPGGMIAILQTNSLTWSYERPEFRDGEFLLKVSGRHFNPDGSVASGYYQMLIPSQIANSWWGELGQEARLSITYENSSGANLVQTSTLKNEAGWFRATISGYQYSSGTIRLKLQNILPVESKPLPISTVKKVVITCKKGAKKIQKTGLAPKCPVGYKKVA